jgi:hypothetical protein
MSPPDSCEREALLDEIFASLAFRDPTSLQVLLGEQAPVAGVGNGPTQKRANHLLESICDRWTTNSAQAELVAAMRELPKKEFSK